MAVKNSTTPRLVITKGNSKLGKGIYTFSTLPGNASHLLCHKGSDVPLTTTPGTCGKHCETCFAHGCYAVNCALRYSAQVIPAWEANTLLLRSGKLFDQIDAFITKKNSKKVQVRIFRINVSGEIENVHQLCGWDNLARKHPETTFSLYTKNYEVLEQFLETRKKPAANLVINVSQWHGVADPFLRKHPPAPDKFNVFEYDDSLLKRNFCATPPLERARLAALYHCPAVTPGGQHASTAGGKPITCDQCQRCYKKTGKTTAVYAH